ncbi:MAG: hypothetical protein QMD44_02955 [Thermodesulfovibrionales bacterium]|jgi:hypothetical protein|nr:hypothetical protein [Thermodesulfovibrionales bacterium]
MLKIFVSLILSLFFMNTLYAGQSAITGLKVSDPKVLIGLSVFLMLIGGMVIDPLTGFICFVLAGILGFIATLKGKGVVKYVAIIFLIITLVLAVSRFPEAGRHLKIYKSKTVAGETR